MFTQFFGNYLLNQKLVTSEQLTEALELQKTTRLKIGVLAINAGYMTAEQINRVHEKQAMVDKRLGDLAVEMGYLTPEQLDELLHTQKTGHLLLGQALVDKGYMTNAQFEAALKDYKTRNSITDADFTDNQNDKISSVIKNFYHFGSFKNADVFTDYVSLFFKNVIRFIGDDFTPLDAKMTNELKSGWFSGQTVKGQFGAFTAISGGEEAYIGFASRFANENLTTVDEMTTASVGEFLNLHNGLFTVNVSNDMGVNLEITPQIVGSDKTIRTESEMFCIPICFSFGTINLILSNDAPEIV